MKVYWSVVSFFKRLFSRDLGFVRRAVNALFFFSFFGGDHPLNLEHVNEEQILPVS